MDLISYQNLAAAIAEMSFMVQNFDVELDI